MTRTSSEDLTHAYTLIHSFLKERSHTKAATALKKAINGIITIDDGVEYKGPTLQKILEEWRELKAAADAIDTSSSDATSSDSDESSSNDDSGIKSKLAGKGASKSKPSGSSGKEVSQVASLNQSQRDSTKTLSSADDPDSDVSMDEKSSDLKDESDVGTVVPSPKEGRKTFRAKKPATSSSDSTSTSSSSSSPDSDDELPNIPKRKAKSTSSSDSSSSSSTDSDSDSDQDTSKLLLTNKPKRKAVSSSSSDSSSSDTSGSSSLSSTSEDLNLSKKQSATQTPARSSSSSSSASSSSPSEDELDETPQPAKDFGSSKKARSSRTDPGSSTKKHGKVIPEPGARATKKRRANDEGSAVITATTTAAKAPAKASRRPNAPFQRVSAQAVKHEELKDNSFESRGARLNDYGARANQDLSVTRGDGFRKEKNKKKRGSYRGGEITLHSHSFKFED